ncbi:alpha/beta hydrolase [Pseudoxanthomonas composti]|uniref:Alpha/beta hydrolase n=1 Tax=Pseudoxanthomonas composti TaxID=2137479 RepID=A0A4Q1JWN3_9GAMM|nr:alpha/beta hydrolase [Pseudoxanthomonas composti]RXR06068.1 alpha/beta hydrolase [Pseudoxanthomonas composti]
MRHRRLLTLLLIAAAGAPAAQARTLGSLDFKPCSLSSPLGGTPVEAQCATLQVPENPAAPNGRKIGLRIGWVPAERDDAAEPDPVFMIAGGPGQSALDSYGQVAPAFAEINKKRHVLLVDQRGTGGSNKLACKEAMDESTTPTAQAASAYTRRCLAEVSHHADPRYYTTGEAIGDLETVRKAIGAARINLVGISYGTRVAQQYAATYPDSTRSLVLDGVAPNSLVLGADFARNLENALDLQFARCAKTPDCTRKLGDPRQKLAALMQKLKTDPPLVRYRDPRSGQQAEERLTAGHVVALVRMSAYLPMMSSILPLQFEEAAQGRYDSLMAASKMITGELSDSITMGMQLSVICAEDGDELRPDPADADTLLGNDFAEFLSAQCKVWPKGTRAASFRKPLTGQVPALLVSGEFDPVTPPRYGDAVAKTLPNARHLVLRGQGHNVIGVGCMPRLLGSFLDTTNAKALDAQCLARLPYTPPFTGFYGWDP